MRRYYIIRDRTKWEKSKDRRQNTKTKANHSLKAIIQMMQMTYEDIELNTIWGLSESRLTRKSFSMKTFCLSKGHSHYVT